MRHVVRTGVADNSTWDSGEYIVLLYYFIN